MDATINKSFHPDDDEITIAFSPFAANGDSRRLRPAKGGSATRAKGLLAVYAHANLEEEWQAALDDLMHMRYDDDEHVFFEADEDRPRARRAKA